MSKRPYSQLLCNSKQLLCKSTQIQCNSTISLTPYFNANKLEKQKAEKMCRNKLKKISKVKSKLCQTVLVRNTLKYVQSTEHVTFSCDEHKPFHKVKCKDITIEDIDNILSEMIVRTPQPHSKEFFGDWTELNGKRKRPKLATKKFIDDKENEQVVPETEILIQDYPSDDDYINDLIINRNNCTIFKLDENCNNLEEVDKNNYFNRKYFEEVSMSINNSDRCDIYTYTVPISNY